MVLSGNCLCGSVAYSSDAQPVATALCHCIDCQKWSGGAFTSNVVVPRDSFKVTAGKPSCYDVTGASGKNNRHFFCATCGSSLFTELDVMPDKTVIKAGGLNGGEADLGGKVDVEFYTNDRVTYLQSVESAKQEPAFG
ncbi:Mss4-like protein [Lipomyces orientalis]|uniref:Mss4-like protein n=1 Tax=Lipomyces orientalis TaxID=1233043 RepID=A0ACC3TEG7_9ASCO